MDEELIPLSDGFAKDATGKVHIMPMRTLAVMMQNGSASKSGDKRACTRRKYIPLKPLVPIPACFEECPSVKRRKIEPIRKELFKVPPQKKEEKRFTTFRKRLSVTRAQSNKTNTISRLSYKEESFQRNETKKPLVSGTPLIDVDEAEAALMNKKLMQKPIVLFPITSIKEESEENDLLKPIDEEEQLTPKSANSCESDAEFLHLEKALASPLNNGIVSPITSVCSLLNSTKLSSAKKSRKEVSSALDSIAAILKEDEVQFQQLKQQFESYQVQRQLKVSKIFNMVKAITEDKENNSGSSRKSTRIAAKESLKNAVSPVISKREDLRKSTLNKNFNNNLQLPSPRTRRAVDMYNSIRTDCSVLCTPKLDRSKLDLGHASTTRSLSRRVQNQCLLLQDTPKPLL